MECPLLHSNTALSSKCHTPSLQWHLLYHFHPQWSFSLGLDCIFRASANTLLCVYVFLMELRARVADFSSSCSSQCLAQCWVLKQCAHRMMGRWVGGLMKKNDISLICFLRIFNVISSEKMCITLPKSLSHQPILNPCITFTTTREFYYLFNLPWYSKLCRHKRLFISCSPVPS